MHHISKTGMIFRFKVILILLISGTLVAHPPVFAGSKKDVTILNLKNNTGPSRGKGGKSGRNKKRRGRKSSEDKDRTSSQNKKMGKGEQIKVLETELYEELYDIYNLISSIKAEIRIMLQEKKINNEKVRNLQKEICTLEMEMSMKRLNFLLKAREIDPDKYVGRDPYKSLRSGSDRLSPNKK